MVAAHPIKAQALALGELATIRSYSAEGSLGPGGYSAALGLPES